jgi:hypothetical protein
MEAAVMSLSTREQHALDHIENRLAGSDPELTALLATFTRLTSGEEMPVREEVHEEGRWTGQVVRRAAAYAGLDRALALLWVLIAVGLIAAAVAMSDSGSASEGACVRSRAVGCAATVPAHAVRAVVPSAS